MSYINVRLFKVILFYFREGIIRLWISHFERNDSNTVNMQPDANNSFSVVHCFESHKQAISGLEMHSHKSILISASIDASIKLFDLDTFTELISLSLESPICLMSKISYGRGSGACFLAFENGTIKLWKMTSCCDLVACSTSRIRSIQTINDGRETEALVALTTHDVFGINHKYSRIFSLESCLLADGVAAVTIDSIYKEIYCVMDDSHLRVFNNESDVQTAVRLGDMIPDIGTITCIVLITGFEVSEFQGSHEYSDIGSQINESTESSGQLLALSSNCGIVYIISYKPSDTSVISSIQANYTGKIHSITYRPHFKDLIVLGEDSEANIRSPGKHYLAARVWSLPKITCTHSILEQSYATCSNVSKSLPYIGFGFQDGSTRIYLLLNYERTQNLESNQRIKEIYSPTYISEVSATQIHDGKVLSLVFCDSLRIYATSGEDGCIILVTIDKRPIRTISLRRIPSDISFFGEHGDIAAAIDRNIVIIRKNRWNLDAIVNEMGVSDEIDPYHWGSNWASNILESLVNDQRYTNDDIKHAVTQPQSHPTAESTAIDSKHDEGKSRINHVMFPVIPDQNQCNNVRHMESSVPPISVTIMKARLFQSGQPKISITEKIINRLRNQATNLIDGRENEERILRHQKVLQIANTAIGIKFIDHPSNELPNLTSQASYQHVDNEPSIEKSTAGPLKDDMIRGVAVSDIAINYKPIQPTTGASKPSFLRGRLNVKFIGKIS